MLDNGYYHVSHDFIYYLDFVKTICIFYLLQEETNLPQFGAPTPSVTIDMLETRPNTHILLDSVTPAAGEGNHRGVSRLDPAGGVMSRALSVVSGSNAQESHISELMKRMEEDPFDEDQVSLHCTKSRMHALYVSKSS